MRGISYRLMEFVQNVVVLTFTHMEVRHDDMDELLPIGATIVADDASNQHLNQAEGL